MTRLRKHVYRVNDRVRILRPRWIKRVGYPLVWTDLMQSVADDPRTAAALEALGVVNASEELLKGIAMQRVREQKFGGNARTIHYRLIAEKTADNWGLSLTDDESVPHHGYVGRIGYVYGKRVVKTGVRFPAYGSGEDWEPGGLTDEKTHVLLRTLFGEIEECDVEPAPL